MGMWKVDYITDIDAIVPDVIREEAEKANRNEEDWECEKYTIYEGVDVTRWSLFLPESNKALLFVSNKSQWIIAENQPDVSTQILNWNPNIQIPCVKMF